MNTFDSHPTLSSTADTPLTFAAACATPSLSLSSAQDTSAGCQPYFTGSGLSLGSLTTGTGTGTGTCTGTGTGGSSMPTSGVATMPPPPRSSTDGLYSVQSPGPKTLTKNPHSPLQQPSSFNPQHFPASLAGGESSAQLLPPSRTDANGSPDFGTPLAASPCQLEPPASTHGVRSGSPRRPAPRPPSPSDAPLQNVPTAPHYNEPEPQQPVPKATLRNLGLYSIERPNKLHGNETGTNNGGVSPSSTMPRGSALSTSPLLSPQPFNSFTVPAPAATSTLPPRATLDAVLINLDDPSPQQAPAAVYDLNFLDDTEESSV